MRDPSRFLVALVLFAAPAAAAQQLPILRYTPPPNTFRQALATPEDYSFDGFNASVQFYPFKAFTGNIEQTFEATLLRDWISPMHQEESVGGKPTFQRLNVPGAELAIAASFSDMRVGMANPHVRMLIVSHGMAAIVDASAAPQSWPQAAAALNAMAQTLRVDSTRAPPPLTAGAGRASAGLYQGVKAKYMAPKLLGMPSSYQTALHFYVLSANGRVYRAYDQAPVSASNISSFDFDAAESRDPGNSGRYIVDGDRLLIQMGGPAPETITAPVPQDGKLTINGVLYVRK